MSSYPPGTVTISGTNLSASYFLSQPSFVARRLRDLARSIAYYRKLGFTFGEPWGGFYAIGERDGLELHLKEAPKCDADRTHRREHEHLDAAAGVDGIESFFAQCVTNGVTILRSLASTEWGTQDFHVEDPDGYVIAFGGRPTKSDTPAASGEAR